MPDKDQDWKDALDTVIKTAIDQRHGAIQFAASYAKYGYNMVGEERRVQALYILNNLVYWRGQTARETKAILQKYAKKGNPQETNND